jgi:glycine dehydrogenase subunit 2
MAVLNANYCACACQEAYQLAVPGLCMHECVCTDKLLESYGVKTLDVAKRLLDYGFYAPTIYFPLVVAGALMIEPTETESKETLDAFIAAMPPSSAKPASSPTSSTMRRPSPRSVPSTKPAPPAAPWLRWYPRGAQPDPPSEPR